MSNEDFAVDFGEITNTGGVTNFDDLSGRPTYDGEPMTSQTQIPKVPTYGKATKTDLGLVKVGDGLDVDENGTLSAEPALDVANEAMTAASHAEETAGTARNTAASALITAGDALEAANSAKDKANELESSLATVATTGNYNDLNNKPTKLTDLTNDAEYQTADEVETAINAKLTTVLDYKGSVASYDNLPTSGQKVGDVYNVEDTGNNYAWDGSSWDKLGDTVDLGGYYTKTETDELLDNKLDASEIEDYYTKTETNGLLDDKLTAPATGTTGQVLTKTDTGTEWADTATVGQLNTKQNLTLTAINQIPKLVKGTYTISGGYYICNGFVSTSSKSLFVDFPMPFVCDGTVTVNSITMSARGVTGYLTDTTSSRVNFLETLATLASVYVHPTGGITIELSKAEGTWVDSSLNNTPVCSYVTGLSFTVS